MKPWQKLPHESVDTASYSVGRDHVPMLYMELSLVGRANGHDVDVISA